LDLGGRRCETGLSPSGVYKLGRLRNKRPRGHVPKTHKVRLDSNAKYVVRWFGR